MSSTAIHISWKSPPISTFNGEFGGYRLYYKVRDSPNSTFEEILVKNKNFSVSVL